MLTPTENDPRTPISGPDLDRLFHEGVDSDVNRYYTAKEHGWRETTWYERYSHFIINGGFSDLLKRFRVDHNAPVRRGMLPDLKIAA